MAANPGPFFSPAKQAHFREHGYVLLEGALDADTLTALNGELERWVEESRDHAESYGEQLDGRPRFSVKPGHSAEHPALRRIASPVELSDRYLEVMRTGLAVDAIAQLIGPGVRFSNAKINLKHPGVATEVKFHQDFVFEPHSNDDLVTILYFLDDLTDDNGPLEVVPGSHRGPLHGHWQDGVFTGAVDDEVAAEAAREAVSCCGPAGTACLMHTRLLHGSAANRSDRPRTLYIISYCAEDAWPLQANHIPSRYEREVVRGTETNQVRCSPYRMEMPEFPTGASFFEQQSRPGVTVPAAGVRG